MELFSSFKKNKNKTALINENGKKYKFKDILDIEKNFKKKVEKDQLILVLANNSISSILSYIVSILNQNKIILIDENLNNAEIEKIIMLYEPSYIVSKIEKPYFGIIQKPVFRILDSLILKTKFKKHDLKKDLLILLPTSGSTGSSKFVQLSKKNIISNTKSILKYLKINSNDRAVTNMPFYYSYMLSILNTHLFSGASIFVSNKTIIEKKFWNEFKKQKITSFNGVPYTWEVLNRVGKEKIFTNNIKYITQAGGKLDYDLANKIYQLCKQKKKDMYIMYGQTEASPRISYIKNENIIKYKGSIGKPINGVNMWIENKNSKKILKPNMKGEIFISGENIMMGYSSSVEDIKITNISKKKLKLNTGDIGYFNEDGFFYITGRSNRIVKIYGNRIDLNEIERKMKDFSINVTCINKENNLVVFFNKKFSQKKIENKLYDVMKLNLNKVKFVKIEKMPMTKNKKINYKELFNLC